jgi:hypothetical protein
MLLSLQLFIPGSVDHAHLLKNIMHQVRTHITGEELEELPLLESKLGPGASTDAAALFSRTKMFDLTRKVWTTSHFLGRSSDVASFSRSHKSAHGNLPFDTLAGFLAAPIDRLRDICASLTTEEMQTQARYY